MILNKYKLNPEARLIGVDHIMYGRRCELQNDTFNLLLIMHKLGVYDGNDKNIDTMAHTFQRSWYTKLYE